MDIPNWLVNYPPLDLFDEFTYLGFDAEVLARMFTTVLLRQRYVPFIDFDPELG